MSKKWWDILLLFSFQFFLFKTIRIRGIFPVSFFLNHQVGVPSVLFFISFFMTPSRHTNKDSAYVREHQQALLFLLQGVTVCGIFSLSVFPPPLLDDSHLIADTLICCCSSIFHISHTPYPDIQLHTHTQVHKTYIYQPWRTARKSCSSTSSWGIAGKSQSI